MLEILKKKILLFLGNPKPKGEYNLKKAKTFLLFPSSGLGDSLVVTPSIRSLRKRYPDSKIYVMVRRRNKDIFKNNSYVDEVMPYSVWSFIKLRNKIDVFVDTNIFIRMKSFILFRILNPKYFITGYKEEKNGIQSKDFSIYKNYIVPNVNQHAYKIFMDYLKPLGLSYDGNGYDLCVNEDSLKEADNFWKKDKLKILVNLFGTNYILNKESISKILNNVENETGNLVDIVVLWENKTFKEIKSFTESDKNFRISYKTDKEQLFSLVKSADIIISPDTGIVHIASAFLKPQLSFFTKDKIIHWAPFGDNIKIVECKTEELPDGKILFNFSEEEALEKLLKIINKVNNNHEKF